MYPLLFDTSSKYVFMFIFPINHLIGDHPVFNDIERIMETAVLIVASTISPIIMLKQKGFSYNSNMALNYLDDINRAHVLSICCSLNISSDEERIQKCDVLHWAKRTGNAAQDE